MSLPSPPRPTHSQVLGSQQQKDQQHHHPHDSQKEQQNPQHHQQEQLQKIKEEQQHQQEQENVCQNQQQEPNRPECQQKQPAFPYEEHQQHREQNQQEQNTYQDEQDEQQQQQHRNECKEHKPNSCEYQHEHDLRLQKQKKEQQEGNSNLCQPKHDQSLYNGEEGEQQHQHQHQDQKGQHHNPSQHQLAPQHQHQNHDRQHPPHPYQSLQHPPHHDEHTQQYFHQHHQHPHLYQQQPPHDHPPSQQHHSHQQHPFPFQQQHKTRGLVCIYPEGKTAIPPTVHYLASPPAQLGGTVGSSLGNVQLSQNQQYVQGSVIHESPIPQHIYPAALASHGEVVSDKDLFLTTLSKFHAALGTKLSIPRIGGKDLDLHLLYKEVTARGGLEMVIKDRKWKEITLVFNFPPTTTSASFVLRKYYFYLLHQYERVYYFQRKGPVDPSPVPLSSVSTASHSVSETESRGRSPFEGPVPDKKKQKIDSAQALGVDPASSIGTVVSGCIDGKFDHGYLVNVTVGTRKMRGVLYHVPPSSTVPQHATVSSFMNSLGNELNANVTEHQIQRRQKKKLLSRKDPGAPRQNRTGYNFFFAEQRARLKSTQPDKDRAISKKIGDLWNSLSEDEKLPYQERGIQEKERYRKEMCEYKERKRLQAQGVMVGTSSYLSSLQTETKFDHMDIDLNVVKSVEPKQELIPCQEQVVQPLSESSSVTSSSNHQTLVPGNSDVNAIKNLSSDDGYAPTIDLQDMQKKKFKLDVSNQQKSV